MRTERKDPCTLDPQQLVRVLTALQAGDFSQRMPGGQPGVAGDIAQTINTTFDFLNTFASEFVRITREIGVEGRFGGQAEIEGLSGTWKTLTDDLNVMAANLTIQVRDMSQVVERIEASNFGRKVTVPAQGETLELKDSINRLADQLIAR
jgi:HAMP domain-containing protein